MAMTHASPMQAAAARMMTLALPTPGYQAMMPVIPTMAPMMPMVPTTMTPPLMMRSFHFSVIVILLFGLAL